MYFDVNEKGEFIGNTTISFENDSEKVEIIFPFENGKFKKAIAKDSKGNLVFTFDDFGHYTKLNKFLSDGTIDGRLIAQKGNDFEKAIKSISIQTEKSCLKKTKEALHLNRITKTVPWN